MMKKLAFTCLFVVCVCHSSSAANNDYSVTTDNLDCGDSAASMRSVCTRTGDLKCNLQTMSISARGLNQSHQRSVALNGNSPPSVKDIVQSWACVTASTGLKYFLLDTHCLVNGYSCTDSDEDQEFIQVIDLNGHNLDLGFGPFSLQRDKIIRKVGLLPMLQPPGVQMQGLKFTEGN